MPKGTSAPGNVSMLPTLVPPTPVPTRGSTSALRDVGMGALADVDDVVDTAAGVVFEGGELGEQALATRPKPQRRRAPCQAIDPRKRSLRRRTPRSVGVQTSRRPGRRRSVRSGASRVTGSKRASYRN